MSRILLLGSQGDPAKDMVYNAIHPLFKIHSVFLEKPVSRLELLRRRVRRLGWMRVLGQVGFEMLVVRPLRFLSRDRIAEIKKIHSLDATPIPGDRTQIFPTVNDASCIERIAALQPDLVLVKGTRILSESLLSAIRAPVVNMHVGITPLYRGVHGAYWALAQNDPEHAGTTIHYVDKGIDTGRIIAQRKVQFGRGDNFVTYPLLQIAAGIELLKEYIPRLLAGETIPQPPVPGGRSRLWSHPTLWFYLRKRIFCGVK